MKFERRNRLKVQLNLTPLIDVILMLVIFFLLASVFRVGPGIAIDLPKSSTAANVSMTELHVRVLAENEVWIDSDRASLSELDVVLKKKIQGKDIDKLRVVVEGGYDVPYQLIVSVLDVLRRNKIEGVNLLTKLGEKKP
jgi:biopolymer transport protein ExbD